jgi:hypothetical protein
MVGSTPSPLERAGVRFTHNANKLFKTHIKPHTNQIAEIGGKAIIGRYCFDPITICDVSKLLI